MVSGRRRRSVFPAARIVAVAMVRPGGECSRAPRYALLVESNHVLGQGLALQAVVLLQAFQPDGHALVELHLDDEVSLQGAFLVVFGKQVL